ncbi:acetate--CoA ligase family protein [Pelotomaculum isophthalicicum JI]|uniref:Acetate--CoA ligase family protein n=1 Tax=Pelotomaculum isophthalicicum JI TaxID=947010 RepID=A0A9X4H8Y9_9FIRM|nr:acetate--CoA ligase family protein [Pelotomaculum isophthalicicum]MDF9409409.1 acetate--CoA ligase family protein [Pelotomaculum isophthalicicum JI]
MDYKKLVKDVLKTGRSHLLEPEAYYVCGEFGITCPQFNFVANVEDGIDAARSMGFPVVVKVVSPQVIHKTDAGGVVTGIQSEEQFKNAYSTMLENVRGKVPDAEIYGVLVQKSMPQGVEVAVGGLRDPQFGPVVMFGAGGTLIEVLQDVSFRLARLDRGEALRQIRETKVFKILQGVRRNKPCDIVALADLIIHAGKLLEEMPEISELDFNPVLAYPDYYSIVDARIVLSSELASVSTVNK